RLADTCLPDDKHRPWRVARQRRLGLREPLVHARCQHERGEPAAFGVAPNASDAGEEVVVQPACSPAFELRDDGCRQDVVEFLEDSRERLAPPLVKAAPERVEREGVALANPPYYEIPQRLEGRVERPVVIEADERPREDRAASLAVER